MCRDCHKALRVRHRDKDNARLSTWRIFNGFKKAAHRAVEQALKSGALEKPQTCMKCGAVARLDAHHVDYAKPMEVLFLCRSCHAAIHNAERRDLRITVPPTRAGLWFIAYLLLCTCYAFPAAFSALHRGPKTISQVESTWHGPAHAFPQEYAR